jgi:hypothetical protein
LFTSLEKHLRLGKSYDNTIVHIENYKVDRWLWIIVYKFFYNNLKIIIAVVSAMAGFAGFLGAIKSLKGSR